MDQLQQQQQQQALPFTSSGTAAAPTMGGGVITVAEVKRELAVLGYDPEAVSVSSTKQELHAQHYQTNSNTCVYPRRFQMRLWLPLSTTQPACNTLQ